MSIEQKYRFKKNKKHALSRIVLKESSEESGFEGESFPLFGISSTLKEYTLCHFLGKKLRLPFERKKDLNMLHPKDRSTLSYSVFRAEHRLNHQEFLLFVNKCRQSVLVEEYSGMEFLLRIKGEISAAESKQLVEDMRQIEGVLLVASLDSRLLRSSPVIHWETPAVVSPKLTARRKKIIQ